MRFDLTGIDAKLFRHWPCRSHLLEDPLPNTALRPPVVAVVDRCVRSVLRGAIAPAASGLKDVQDAPLITRRSSTRGLPGLPCGRWGSIAAQAASDNQNKCVIAASLSVRPNEGRDSPKYSTCCMSSQPRVWTHSDARRRERGVIHMAHPKWPLRKHELLWAGSPPRAARLEESLWGERPT